MHILKWLVMVTIKNFCLQFVLLPFFNMNELTRDNFLGFFQKFFLEKIIKNLLPNIVPSF